jgi:cytidylate kinase
MCAIRRGGERAGSLRAELPDFAWVSCPPPTHAPEVQVETVPHSDSPRRPQTTPGTPGAVLATQQRPFVVAIDGPSGAGKSTVSRMLAKALGARYLDTGAMYRAVTVAVLEAGADPAAADEVSEVLGRTELRPVLDPDHPQVWLADRDVTELVRGPDVTGAVSSVSAVPEVRARLVAIQREAIERSESIVVEGRDIGTVVVPDAPVKVFLTAAPDARAQRRNLELRSSSSRQSGNNDRTVDSVTDTAVDLARRDALDSSRTASPLRQAADAVEIDTTAMRPEDVVEVILELVTRAQRESD